MNESLVESLKKVIAGEVDAGNQTLETYSRDASLFVVKPKVVVRPQNVADIEALVSYVKSPEGKAAKLSLTPRAAGTDMGGGPLSDSIVVDVVTHMNKLLKLENGMAVVEPGMYFRDFDKKTVEQGFILPSYTASRELCTVGGMAANDSGGEKNLVYGKTSRYVKELEVVLTDGKTYVLKPLSEDELSKKCLEDTFEGKLYRDMRSLVERNEKKIEAARPHVSKNSSGYALWRVRDAVKKTFDLSQLFVGSQGTLGIITKITFSLIRPRKHSAMTVIFLNDLSILGEIVKTVGAHGPESFESYDDHTFALAVKYFPEFAKQMKAGIVSLGFQFLPELWMMATGGVPKLVLLAEFTAETAIEAEDMARKVGSEVRKKFKLKVKIAPNEKAARKYWVIRRESFNLLRKKVRGLRTAPFIDDFVVPPECLSEFLPKLNVILNEYKLTYTIAGHVGDGNFHIIPLMDPHDDNAARVIDELSHKVYDLVLSYRGSISGEHNDGLIRAPYVEQMFGTEMFELFREVKRIFDPENIFNPGKKINVDKAHTATLLDLHPYHPDNHTLK